ncbi:MAG: hypothetical protein QW478_12335 [Candidatus Micrarchaeaceae archaeon]
MNKIVTLGLAFQDPRFSALKVRIKSKEPLEKGSTTTNNYAFNNEKINGWTRQGDEYE